MIVIYNQINLVHHFYSLFFNIKEFHLESEKVLRKTRVVNLYNNKVGKRQL